MGSAIAGAVPVGIVNQTLARRFFPTGNATGRHIRLEDGLGKETIEIIGVVGDVRQAVCLTRPNPKSIPVVCAQAG
jgi:putative ABC transport system permease protein